MPQGRHRRSLLCGRMSAITIIEAIDDPKLLAPFYAGDSRPTWLGEPPNRGAALETRPSLGLTGASNHCWLEWCRR